MFVVVAITSDYETIMPICLHACHQILIFPETTLSAQILRIRSTTNHIVKTLIFGQLTRGTNCIKIYMNHHLSFIYSLLSVVTIEYRSFPVQRTTRHGIILQPRERERGDESKKKILFFFSFLLVVLTLYFGGFLAKVRQHWVQA